MKQVVQPIGGGPVNVLDVPRPSIGPTQVLVRTHASIISPGTERAITSLAQSSMLNKARARPDLVRQVIKKARTEGVSSTLQTVRARLASDLPLGYSAAGVVVEVGEAVASVRPGQLVATGGAGAANHAEWQAVPGLLAVPVPQNVNAADAAFTTIASIALHGLRLAEVGPGSKVVVVGLGLIGQLASRLALAAGCEVVGIDVSAESVRVALESGVIGLQEQGDATTRTVLDWSRGRGADAVLLCAAGASSAVAQRTPAICRDRARVVVVGDVGLELSRAPFYEKELSLLFARSYGPGRYEQSYEDFGVDFPVGQVRWSEGRNFEAVLDLLASKRLRVDDLVTHRFAIGSAEGAYELIESRREPYLAIALEYEPEISRPHQSTPSITRTNTSTPGIGWIGAGAFSTGVLLPAFKSAGFERLLAVASGSGLTAARLAERHGFEVAVSSAAEVIGRADVDIVVIATPHDTHATLVEQALRAGKNVWCEKPLALDMQELERVRQAADESGAVLMVGFNRRYSPMVRELRKRLAATSGPMVLNYRVSAGRIPDGHWYADRRQGGRLIGEACHFIDTCCAVVDSPVEEVAALSGGRGEVLLSEDVAVIMRHADGSLSTLSYAAGGHSGTAKERLEVLGGGSTYVLDDFRELSLNGSSVLRSHQDKGHEGAVRQFSALLRGQAVPDDLTSSMRVTLLAAAAMVDPEVGIVA